MTISTNFEGQSWIAPVAYAYDQDFNFFWFSETTARHSLHISSNPSVAAAIFDSRAASDEADGLQMSGMAGVVDDGDLARIAELYWLQSFPDKAARERWRRPLSCFQGAAPQRFYRFTPQQVYKCDPEFTTVDRRILVDLGAD